MAMSKTLRCKPHFLARRNLLIKHGEQNEVIFALLDPVVRQGLHA